MCLELIRVESLRCLREISGWEVLNVRGSQVGMVHKEDLTVSFNVDTLAQGGSATLEMRPDGDVFQQFVHTALSSNLKGDPQSVLPYHNVSDNRSSAQSLKHTTSPPPSPQKLLSSKQTIPSR